MILAWIKCEPKFDFTEATIIERQQALSDRNTAALSPTGFVKETTPQIAFYDSNTPVIRIIISLWTAIKEMSQRLTDDLM